MSDAFKAVKISDHVYWVGAIDWAVSDFHGYLTRRGTTYNAYLVTAEKPTLIDTVRAPFFDEMMARIRSVMDPEKIDYIVSNHSEMDHSGALQKTIETVKPEKVFASKSGVMALSAQFHELNGIEKVATGDCLDLGDMGLTFIETRMLHWPDSMFSFLDKDSVLFSQDGFGMHLATSERFDDELDWTILEEEAARYYANILLPLSGHVLKLCDKLPRQGLDIKLIAPDHGPVWRKDHGKILDLWQKWAKQEPTGKVVVVYDTMWGSTEKMAAAVTGGVASSGASVVQMPLHSVHRSDVAAEILDAGALIVGTPTINNNMFPTIADVLSYLKGLKPINLFGAAFGSYGWSGEGPRQVHGMLEEMKMTMPVEPLRVKYVPGSDALADCHQFGLSIAGKLENCRDRQVST